MCFNVQRLFYQNGFTLNSCHLILMPLLILFFLNMSILNPFIYPTVSSEKTPSLDLTQFKGSLILGFRR